MHEMPLVTVIIIFFNAERFLEEAISSIFEQTYDNWELLLVDDGSGDGSTALAVELAHRHPRRVRYLEHPTHANRGMSATRNLGIRHAHGKYIAFLDADDVWMPEKLSEQTALLERHPQAGMTYGRALIWSSWTDENSLRDHTLPLGVPAESLISAPNLLPKLLRNKVQSPMTSNAMFRRALLEVIGGFEDEFTGMYEDQVFFSKVELNAAVYVSGSCWVKYRQHATSCSALSARVGSYLSERWPFLQWLSRYLDSMKVPVNPAVRRALRRELWPYRHPRINVLVSPIAEIIERTKAFVANREAR